MKNKEIIIVMSFFLMLSGCESVSFLDKIFPSEEPDETMKLPGEYYLSDRRVCGQALDLTSSPLVWDPLSTSSEYVQETKRLKLSIQQCAELLGLKTN